METKPLFWWVVSPEYTLGFYSTFEKAKSAVYEYEAEHNPSFSPTEKDWQSLGLGWNNRRWKWAGYSINAITELNKHEF